MNRVVEGNRDAKSEAESERNAEGEEAAEEIMIEQGKQESSRYENIVGKGANLWRSDEEFEEFLIFIDALRHPERHPARAVRQ